jgi:hypothetical protein
MSFGGWNARAARNGPWDVADARKQHNKWLAEHDKTLMHIANELGDSAIRLAQAQKQVKNRTGELRGGWKKSWRRTPGKIQIALISRVKHAYFQERGTGLWGPSGLPIRPKHAKFLRWVDPASGRVMFRRSVRGVPPKWIGKRATFNAFQLGKSMFRRELSATASRF